jgi:hypothetical protein
LTGVINTPRQFGLDQPVVGPGVPLADAQLTRIEPLLPDGREGGVAAGVTVVK